MPVLYGVFLYMGVSSLQGIQVRHASARAVFLHWELICPDQGGRALPEKHKSILEKLFPSLTGILDISLDIH